MRSWFWFSASIYIGTLFLKFSPPTELRIERIFLIIALLQVAVLGTSIISFFVERYVKSQAAHGSAAQTSIALIDFFARLVFMVAIILFGLNNLGVDITALIAGLGIGGIAVALALQNVLGDLFASLSIVLDKPFV
ncbi:MAG: mechanosensitive ion channel, partial [Proteobacteria bacterium]